MSAHEVQAYDWMDKGEKSLKKKVMPMFGNPTAKFEEAVEAFSKAANLFKMAKKYDEAGKAFIKVAEAHLKLDSKHEAASSYASAATCFRKNSTLECVDCLRKAVELFTGEGRFAIAAKHQKEIAEVYEAELDFEKAIEAYQTAADFFEGESSTSQANTCLLKVAQFSAQLENYSKAVELYEQVARSSLENNLLKWGAKEHLHRALLCHLAAEDLVGAQKALDNYKTWDASFASSRECKFVEEIMKAVEKYDVDAFTQAVVDYDSISPLDNWKTKVLLKVKQGIASNESETGGGLA
jgi:alpha-soluble NSF attachment protein